LHSIVGHSGRRLSAGSRAIELSVLRQFLVWWGQLHPDQPPLAPAISLPRRPDNVPRAILTEEEAEAVLAVPTVHTLVGLRDRCILETFYSTGIRRQELITLSVSDLDWHRQTLLVRAGKGLRDRVLPVGRRLSWWLEQYLNGCRTRLIKRSRWTEPLFLTLRGNPLRPARLSEMVRRYIRLGDSGKVGSCHLFRHTAATLMLEGGADIRDIQALLGHKRLSTTAIYTRVSIKRLQAVHARTHPAERAFTMSIGASDSVSAEQLRFEGLGG